MPLLRKLTEQEIAQEIAAAAREAAAITVTVRCGGGWRVLPSRIVGLAGGRLLAAAPEGPEAIPLDHAGGDVGLALKRRHHKLLGVCTLHGLAAADGAPALALGMPSRMERVDRRAYARGEVPAEADVTASFWPGGLDAEHAAGSPDVPDFAGRVTGLSAGGLQLLTDAGAADAVRVGDAVGTRIRFGDGGEPVAVEAQLRYARRTPEGLVAGFQFVALALTPQGREVLELIAGKASGYRRGGSGAGPGA